VRRSKRVDVRKVDGKKVANDDVRIKPSPVTVTPQMGKKECARERLEIDDLVWSQNRNVLEMDSWFEFLIHTVEEC
jgi:hypothetical protein